MSNDARIAIDEALVRQLVATQFPKWARLPVRRVEWDGWDNSTFRLGDRMKVRLHGQKHQVKLHQAACAPALGSSTGRGFSQG